LGGNVAGCSDCKGGLAMGGVGWLGVGYQLGMGLGFTVDVGYAWLRQNVKDRASTLTPLVVGASPPENGTSDDELTLKGVTLGGSFFFHGGKKITWLARVGGGVWLASVTDRRSGRFTTTLSVQPDGTPGAPATYSVDPTEQVADARYAYVSPELRVGTFLGNHLELSASVGAFIGFALGVPHWSPNDSRIVSGTCRDAPGAHCVTDGLVVYDAASLTGRNIVLVVPGIALRYEL
jgi:hypothetical protein